MPSKLTLNNFIDRSNLVHKHKYDYSKVEYQGAHIKIEIICKKHGSFMQRPYCHLSLQQECPECCNEERRQTRLGTKDEFIKRAKQVHGDRYDYSKIKYIGAHTEIEIICREHRPFWQTPSCHVDHESGCPQCGGTIKCTTQQFIEKANLIHKNKYNYSKIEYKNNRTKIEIICIEHGSFWQTPDKHTNQQCGCPSCKSISKGQKIIEQWLKINKIKFLSEHKFENCINPRTNKHLRFDFFLPKSNVCIEFDGQHHFNPVQFNGISLKKAKANFVKTEECDFIKNQFCKNNNINLVRIKHTDKRKIPAILQATLLT